MLSDLIDGRYRVDQEVGRGGMGIVFRAYDTRLNRTVALKILRSDATHDPKRLRRLAAEALAASALNHPSIATVYDFVELGPDSFIVYEYIDGRTLRDELEHKGFTTDDVLDIGIQVADALSLAHSHGITHLDLKPENIMLAPEEVQSRWRVKILDFGLAKRHCEPLSGEAENGAETISIATLPGLLVGTLNYMAPEQLETRSTDGRTDIYTLGLVLYEMASGTNPFLGKTPASTVANILKQDPPPLPQKNPQAPAELNRILLKCLRKHPNERYQSARELLTELRDLQHAWASPPPRPVQAVAPATVSRFFSLFGATPERRWEILQVRMFLWCLLLAYLGWRFAASAGGVFDFILFPVQLACILLLAILISFLFYIRALDPSDLPHQVQRLAPWMRGLIFGLVLVTWAMSVAVIASHPVLAAFLFLCSTAGGLKYTLFKTAIERAISPKLR